MTGRIQQEWTQNMQEFCDTVITNPLRAQEILDDMKARNNGLLPTYSTEENETFGTTLLHEIIERSATDMSTEAVMIAANMLILNGANVNAQDVSGYTPLMDASGLSDIMVIRTLVENGARIEMSNNEGKTAIDIANETGRGDVVLNFLNQTNIEGALQNFVPQVEIQR